MFQKETIKLMCLTVAIFAALAVQADARLMNQMHAPPQAHTPATAQIGIRAPDGTIKAMQAARPKAM